MVSIKVQLVSEIVPLEILLTNSSIILKELSDPADILHFALTLEHDK